MTSEELERLADECDARPSERALLSIAADLREGMELLKAGRITFCPTESGWFRAVVVDPAPEGSDNG